jgi:hypothetical protein
MWTDRQAVMTKLIVAFRNFEKAPKNEIGLMKQICMQILLPNMPLTNQSGNQGQ